MARQGRLGDDPAFPDGVQQIVLADDPFAVEDEIEQQVENCGRSRWPGSLASARAVQGPAHSPRTQAAQWRSVMRIAPGAPLFARPERVTVARSRRIEDGAPTKRLGSPGARSLDKIQGNWSANQASRKVFPPRPDDARLIRSHQLTEEPIVTQRIVVIGAGFAGVFSALSAARLRDLQRVSPWRTRNRRGSARAFDDGAPAPLRDQTRRDVCSARRTVRRNGDRLRGRVSPDHRQRDQPDRRGDNGWRTSRARICRLVLAAGSRLVRPPIPGLAEFGFSVDRRDEADALDQHLRELASRPLIGGAQHGGASQAAGSPASRPQPSSPGGCARFSALMRRSG